MTAALYAATLAYANDKSPENWEHLEDLLRSGHFTSLERAAILRARAGMSDTLVMPDRRTRHQGVFARHKQACRVQDGKRCNCTPAYFATVYDSHRKRTVKSPHFREPQQAQAWRKTMIDRLGRGPLTQPVGQVHVHDAARRFLAGIKDGSVRNKRGQRYRLAAVRDYESALTVHVLPAIGTRKLTDVTRGDLQGIVDDMQARLSGSRVRSAVTACRAMWRWALDRELTDTNPARSLALPALDETTIDRVPTPAEFAQLLALLDPEDRAPFAIAGYATARREEIRQLRWGHVDRDNWTIQLARDGGKTQAASRTVGVPQPLRVILRAAYLRAGRPGPDDLVCQPRRRSSSQRMSFDALLKRTRETWGTDAIGLHHCRHMAGSHMLDAGVNIFVVSRLMGHAGIEITCDRYGHPLPWAGGDAVRLVDSFLDSRSEESG